MNIEQLAETIRQQIAQSSLIQGDINDVRRGLRVRNVIDGVVRETGVVLDDEEKRALVKLVTNSTL